MHEVGIINGVWLCPRLLESVCPINL
jgi:hypothetical protein